MALIGHLQPLRALGQRLALPSRKGMQQLINLTSMRTLSATGGRLATETVAQSSGRASLLPRRVPLKTANSLNKPFNDRKKFLVDMYEQQLTSPVYLIMQNNNITVGEFNALRSALKEKCHPLAQIGVVRSAMMKAVVRGTAFENLTPLFTGPVAIMYLDFKRLKMPFSDLANTDVETLDAMHILKSMVDIVRTERKLLLLGGKIDEQLLNLQLTQRMVSLPDRAVLHSQLVAGIFGPVQALHQTINQIPQSLVFALDQHQKNLEEPEQPKENTEN
ncbi:hypothetical protein IWQ62_001057 [Dispira parvispora]|uniref:50S ribosomal protein L10 n=1 Tax=Dispira parvispora TaxID=1520584 RepID=A0A9W8AUI7_9FUNG|nr:hypothetical protein IWQ62_001057 [Dispira parvispora]